jgi:hypothetical protein
MRTENEFVQDVSGYILTHHQRNKDSDKKIKLL